MRGQAERGLGSQTYLLDDSRDRVPDNEAEQDQRIDHEGVQETDGRNEYESFVVHGDDVR